MKATVFLIAAVIAGTLGNSYAVERGARLSDAVAAKLGSFNDGESLVSSLWGEVAVPTEDEEWSLLAGGNYGMIFPEGRDDDISLWAAGLGLKRYLFDLTSLALIANYEEYDFPNDPNALAGTIALKQRFVPADDAISPFMSADFTRRSASKFSDAGDNRIPDKMWTIGLGCDFMVGATWAFVVEAVYSDADETTRGYEFWEGWLGSIAMKYYWDWPESQNQL